MVACNQNISGYIYIYIIHISIKSIFSALTVSLCVYTNLNPSVYMTKLPPAHHRATKLLSPELRESCAWRNLNLACLPVTLLKQSFKGFSLARELVLSSF